MIWTVIHLTDSEGRARVAIMGACGVVDLYWPEQLNVALRVAASYNDTLRRARMLETTGLIALAA